MASIIKPSEIKRFEVTPVYSHPEAVVDIVLVHGLNGNPQKTWTAKNGVFWPNELLPKTLKNAKVRILVYGYNADVYAFGEKSPSADMIHQHAQSLVRTLALERQSKGMENNPIIWVAHSLGGILLKRALLYSNDLTSKSADRNRSIYVATYGIIFLGTPHVGSDQAKMGIILQAMCDTLIPKTLFHTESQLVKTLKSNNETLLNINLHFLDIYQRFEIDFVHENMKTVLGSFKAFVVDQNSASPQLPDVSYYGIEATHSGMCKFESVNAPGYPNVSETINTWIEKAPTVVRSRFLEEARARQQDKENKAREMMGIYAEDSNMTRRLSQDSGANMSPEQSNTGNMSTSMIHSVASIEPRDSTPSPPPSTSQPILPTQTYFIKPHGFRPNSLFVGRQFELSEMHKMLFDRKRRSEGTAAVLLQSLPGGGKTHLARQYVFEHIDDFPGGIFWVRAKSQEQLAAGFWEIARRVALKSPSASASAVTVTTTAATEETPKDPERFIEVVTEWFRDHHEWLLVLDGIHFDHSKELQRFIPDSTNSSLIYTSTERGVGGDHHFMNPQVIKIPLLSAREAQELFLLELDKKNPSTEDKKHSMELVQRMGFLPLVIHAAATRLKATEEPLAKFARTYATGPKLRDLDTYKSIVEELTLAGAVEVLNLMNIICFFSGHIPVEMIALGLKALDVPTKAGRSIADRSLNNTFKILNRYALIDRSSSDTMRSSQSSKGSSKEGLSDDVDIIRLHSVVQDFFVDSLRAEDSLPRWLGRAVALFRRSYERADQKIRTKDTAGLVGDYRSYEIHGTRLLDHVTRNEKKFAILRETHEVLADCLRDVKTEIDRRTRQSSQDIVHGRQDAFQTSIFDRTSSSSDTGPDTPGQFDKHSSGISTWGTDIEKGSMESPVSMHGDGSFHVHEDVETAFPVMPTIEDQGYDTDREDGVSMTIQPSQRTTRPDDAESWNLVRHQRSPPRQDNHRTVKVMEQNRYRDRAGAWRAIHAAPLDPRVALSNETAEGVMERIGPLRPPSRGRMSGQSQAEVALNQINKSSPPPPRGGGEVIQDRRRSSQRKDRTIDSASDLISGEGSYAHAVSGVDKYAVMPSARPRDRSTSHPSPRPRPASPAMTALQAFPHSAEMPRSPLPPYLHDEVSRPIPYRPYPSTDSIPDDFANRQSQVDARTEQRPRSYPFRPAPAQEPTLRYIPGTSSPLKRDLPHGYGSWHSQNYDTSPPSFNFTNPTPRYAASEGEADGYTSQPMSRDTSNRSNPSHSNQNPFGPPSLTETEPAPDLPSFSPRIGPTSYQMYENMREAGGRGRKEGLPVRKSPRLGFARAALIERVDEWSVGDNIRPSRQTFDPRAPIFEPRAQSQPPTRTEDIPLNLSRITDTPAPPSLTSSTPSPFVPDLAPGMERSSSGGVRVGNRMIAFGDFPEPVDFVLARERVERQRADRRAFEEGLFRERYTREQLKRERSDRIWDRDEERVSVGGMIETGNGRPRGLSSPERGIGLGLELEFQDKERTGRETGNGNGNGNK